LRLTIDQHTDIHVLEHCVQDWLASYSHGRQQFYREMDAEYRAELLSKRAGGGSVEWSRPGPPRWSGDHVPPLISFLAQVGPDVYDQISVSTTEVFHDFGNRGWLTVTGTLRSHQWAPEQARSVEATRQLFQYTEAL
jgi:hypothetical protein